MSDDSEKKEIIARSILEILKGDKINLKVDEILKRIETPPSPELGDFAFPCFFCRRHHP